MIQSLTTPHIPTLSAWQLNEFLRKSTLTGHDTDLLLAGEEITTYGMLESFDAARELMCNATSAQRKLRQASFFNDSLLSRVKLGQGMHDRGEAVVMADFPVTSTEKDAKGINRHFPLAVKKTSVLHKIISKGEIWDVSVTGERWNLGEMEELYNFLNVGTLVLEEGARLVIRGNVFSFLCQQLICEENASSHHYHIGILPTPYSVDFGYGPINGPNGMHACNGRDGTHGRQPLLNYGTLGAWLPDEPNAEMLNGTDGEDGKHGHDATKGRNGGMCKLAELTIRNLKGNLTVFSQAGDGGNGGNGGDGGRGGNGGNAAAGVKGFNKIIEGGQSGKGGNGGNGGRGGNAGHGGLASNIYLRVPDEAISNITMISLPSVGGQGGHGGKGGKAGIGGKIQSSTDEVLKGIDGIDGIDGTDGKTGQDGRLRPAAVMHLNDEQYTKTKNIL